MENKLTRERLKKIVEEELDKLVQEAAVDHKGISTIVNGASTLLAAFDKFEKKATPEMKSALGPAFEKMQQALHNMITNPASYVPQVKKVRKVVSLAPAKSAGTPTGQKPF